MFGVEGLICIVAVLFSGWWYSQKDQPQIMGNPTYLKTYPIPLSLGFTFFFASAFILLFMVSPFSLGAGVIFACGLQISALGIFLPHILLTKEQKTTAYASTWMRKISFIMFSSGLLIPVTGLVLIDRYFKSGILVTGVMAIAILIAVIFTWIKTRKYSNVPADPVIVRSVKIYNQFEFVYVAILLIAIIAMIVLHKHGII